MLNLVVETKPWLGLVPSGPELSTSVMCLHMCCQAHVHDMLKYWTHTHPPQFLYVQFLSLQLALKPCYQIGSLFLQESLEATETQIPFLYIFVEECYFKLIGVFHFAESAPSEAASPFGNILSERLAGLARMYCTPGCDSSGTFRGTWRLRRGLRWRAGNCLDCRLARLIHWIAKYNLGHSLSSTWCVPAHKAKKRNVIHQWWKKYLIFIKVQISHQNVSSSKSKSHPV